jgi:hypothetical protein
LDRSGARISFLVFGPAVPDSLDRLANAFDNLAAKPSLGLMHRYQTRLNLNYQRTLYNILLLRAATVPNEPSPISEHPATVNVPVTKENQP